MKKGKTRKIIAFLLAAVMVLAMCIPAMAADNYTITVNNAKNGETYTAYKIFDASYASETDNAVSYTADKAIVDLITNNGGVNGLTFKQIGNSDKFVVTLDNNLNENQRGEMAKQLAELLHRVTNELKGEELSKITSPISVKAGDSGATITVPSKGYYFVDTTLGSLCALGTAKNVTVDEKNTIPSEEKTVSDTENGNYGENANAQIGDKVYYQIKVTDSKGTDKAITVHDTMSKGLTLDTGSISVTKDGQIVSEDNYSKKMTGLTDGCTFEVTLKDKYVKTLEENDVVVIKYSATLNEQAVAGTDETNTSKLTYSNQTTTDKTTVKTYKFQVKKYDGADAKDEVEAKDSKVKNLGGAHFKLLDENKNPVKLVKVKDTEYRVANGDESGAVNEFVTVDSGNITITGVDADEGYFIEETEAPAGYNKLTGPKSITVNADNSLVQPVENNKGTALPSTGGRGTRIFYLVGIICVAGAGIVLVSRRRMSR
ncbi:MAG: SpaH/EbpB family LPXTG-anchored major pilin [Eubacterium sp.]